MIKGLDNFVTLRESDHRYFDKAGQEYVSVSKFIGNFYKKFDADFIAGATAASEGVSKQEILDKWAAQTAEGSRRHAAIERYFKTTQILDSDLDLKPMILNIASQYKDYYQIHNEVVLYDKDSLIAGTSDLPLVCTSSHKSILDIGDFKNYGKGINQKEVDKHGDPRNEYMLNCLSHLQNSSYNKVAIQLSLYGYMLEKQTGRKIGKLFAHFIDPVNPLINFQIPIPYMKDTIEKMILWKLDSPINLQENIAPEKTKDKNLNHIKPDWDL